jgi:predicted nucleic acid-binding protein
MRVVLDACVLYPTGLRGLLLDVAETGYFTPLWSDRIIEEWRRAALRQDSDAGVEIALLQARWPEQSVDTAGFDLDGLWLPDPDDRHVLAAAIAGEAGELVTANLRDFPSRILSGHGISLRHPDTFLLEFARQEPVEMARFVAAQVKLAENSLGQQLDMRTFLKRSHLPRLGKFLQQAR